MATAVPPTGTNDNDRLRVIVLTTIHWPSTTRLCLALAEGGFDVHVIAPDDHAVHSMKGLTVSRLGLTEREALASIASRVARYSPHLLVPGDEQAIGLLRKVYARAFRGSGKASRGIAGLIETSLGASSSFAFGYQKSRFIALARSEGLNVPATSMVSGTAQLRALADRATFPVVLKQDDSFGGRGVRIAHNVDEALQGYAELRAASGPISGVKQAFKKLDPTWLARLWRPVPTITLQQYIPGRPANRAGVCWRGEILAGLSAEVLKSTNETSPATVVRLIDCPAMEAAAARMVRLLGLSGFVGFDFVLEARTGQPFLIEMNARPTQICHIALDVDSDMIGALAQALRGLPCRRRTMPTVSSRTVALFPQEAWRDPASNYLISAHHDVPWRSPEFVLAYHAPVPMEPLTWLDLARLRMVDTARLFRRPAPNATQLLGGKPMGARLES